MRKLNLDELEIFQAVATAGGVTAASKLLHRVPSNITTRLKQMEERLGVRLFNRCDNRLSLTPEGNLLLNYAERLFQLVGEAELSLSERRPMGTLRIGSLESTAGARLPTILSDYTSRHTDVQLEIRTDTTAGLIEAVSNCEIEGALVSQPFWAPRLSAAPIFREELVLISGSQSKPTNRIQDIDCSTLICFPQGCSYRKVVEGWLSAEGITPIRFVELASYPSIIGCVVAGTGVAIVPLSVVDSLGIRDEVQRHRLPIELSRNITHFVWRPERESLALRAFLSLLQQHATDLGTVTGTMFQHDSAVATVPFESDAGETETMAPNGRSPRRH
ncbi:hypothetical protein B1C78_14515 [Thioalkalivibrio denitrificans]|uniref:HTH lysR-type domain-containing protein n=1 Tax=Thioalkalivibrio denitrificans TaxID=108003 RepID=A0A1V3NC75_9GAMM|nr:LysR family transcriptional regulator [Thioalkalivibrio denitrificans]OOG22645.1 hypothetical protein B1C78_14515 [Thioalkalivibrio denitrificans]